MPALFYFFFILGAILFKLKVFIGFVELMSLPLLLITSSIVLISLFRAGCIRLLWWGLAVYVIVMALEAISVHTGLVFGTYTYHNMLGISVFGVPLIIGILWITITASSISVAGLIQKNIYTKALLAGIIATAFDAVMEQAVLRLRFWQWQDNYIPLQNYIMWFSVVFLVSLLYQKIIIVQNNRLAIHYLISQFIFFGIVAL
ncbi:carotenoid biosynthesis protein [Candidatus Omnitrophota bacterium]